MMFHAHLPSRFWVECFFTITFLINRLPSSHLGMDSPFFLLFGKQPDYSTFRVFGCKCFPYLGDYQHDKLSPKSLPCVFLGYSIKQKDYKCLYPPTSRIMSHATLSLMRGSSSLPSLLVSMMMLRFRGRFACLVIG
jgi:hypothetical protein